MSITSVQAKLAEAAVFIEAGDFASAKPKILAAQALLMGIPDLKKGTEEVRFFRDQISSLLAECRQQAASSLGIQFAPVTYTEPTT
jgi:hypothetical protein